MISIMEIYWLAGVLEGEAHFSMGENGCMPRISLSMTDMDVVIRVAEITGAENVRKKKTRNTKQQYQVRITGQKSIQWMMTMYLLMGDRRKEKIRQIIEKWKNDKRKVKNYFRPLATSTGDSIVWQKTNGLRQAANIAISRVCAGEPAATVARDFGTTRNSLLRWKKVS